MWEVWKDFVLFIFYYFFVSLLNIFYVRKVWIAKFTSQKGAAGVQTQTLKAHPHWRVPFSEGNKLHFPHKAPPAAHIYPIVLTSVLTLWISPFHISVPPAQHPPNFRERLLRAFPLWNNDPQADDDEGRNFDTQQVQITRQWALTPTPQDFP